MPSTSAPAPLVVLIRSTFDPLDERHCRLIGDLVDRSVHLVAPAGPLPGERWIIDLTAREAAAVERLASWTGALERHVSALTSEVGDPRAGLALADAMGARPGADVAGGVAGAPRGTNRPARRGGRGRLAFGRV